VQVPQLYLRQGHKLERWLSIAVKQGQKPAASFAEVTEKGTKPLVMIKGAGDLASGVAYRLYKCGIDLVMTEIAEPLVVRRRVAFAEAVYDRMATVEDVQAKLFGSQAEVPSLLADRIIPVQVFYLLITQLPY